MTESNQATTRDLILEELKRRHRSKEVVDVEKERIKVLIFVCGTHLYAFHGADVREILPKPEISWVPGLPDYLPGLINVRGDVESVVAIRHFLAEEPLSQGDGLIAMVRR